MDHKILKVARGLFYLFIFLLPWQTRYFLLRASSGGYELEAGNLAIYGTELWLWVIMILAISSLFKKSFWSEAVGKIKFLKFKPQFLVVSLFIIWSGLSIFWSVNGAVAYWQWFKLLEAMAAGSLIIILKVDFKKIATMLAASGAAQGLLAFWQFSTQQIVANKWLGLAAQNPADLGVSVVENTGRWLRAYGSFPHPNILGGFLAVTILVSVYLIIQSDKLRIRLWLLVALVLQVLGLVLTFSRAAIFLGLGLAIIYSLLLIKNKLTRRRAAVVLISLVLVATVGYGLWGELLINRFTDSRLTIKSNNERQIELERAYSMIKARPLWGWGLGSYQLALLKLNPGQPAYQYQPPHNLFWLTWAELGLVGLSLWLLILIITVWQAIKQKSGFVVYGLGLIFLLIWFDHYFWASWSMLVIFWLMIYFGLIKKEE
ncbi:MAG: O-antigen ligase family protein [Candidatus Buchananbacteria bacterium]